MRVVLGVLFMGFLAEADKKDYYKILNVDSKATLPEIKKAFRDLARHYHPDKNDSPDAPAKFTQIQEAYDVLKSEETRKMYDHARESGMDFNPNSASSNNFRPAFFRAKPFKFNFESLFEDLAGFDPMMGPAGASKGFDGFPFEDLFKDFDFPGMPGGGLHIKKGGKRGGRRKQGRMSCKTVVQKVGGLTTTITQCS
eukprot:TRINITY_DN10969_c0_g2_i1.p1 TRINITY_DN10969_c0_g2~~TRINITY_DN10969_c0_g2_i1.p1  ORF type:complete len:197 (+),score=31.45 TRINITY_DN10969_c0_g2_i1:39-629(+)